MAAVALYVAGASLKAGGMKLANRKNQKADEGNDTMPEPG
jgi:hypothetical protein